MLVGRVVTVASVVLVNLFRVVVFVTVASVFGLFKVAIPLVVGGVEVASVVVVGGVGVASVVLSLFRVVAPPVRVASLGAGVLSLSLDSVLPPKSVSCSGFSASCSLLT